jgi:hypothetical protein
MSMPYPPHDWPRRTLNQISRQVVEAQNFLLAAWKEFDPKCTTNTFDRVMVAGTVFVQDARILSKEGQTIAYSAAYLMHEYDLDIFAFSKSHRGGLILGKHGSPIITVGNCVWGNNDREGVFVDASLTGTMLRSKGINRYFAYGSDIRTMCKRLPPSIFKHDHALSTPFSDQRLLMLYNNSVHRFDFSKVIQEENKVNTTKCSTAAPEDVGRHFVEMIGKMFSGEVTVSIPR